MAGLLGWVIVAAIAADFFWWIVGAIAVAAAAWWLWREYQRAVTDLAECEAERLAILARADEQQAQVLAGDPAGTHGQYPPTRL